MKSYIIVFEIKPDSVSREKLVEDKIREYGFYAFPTTNSSIIFTEETVVQVRDKLMKLVTQEDKLFVAEIYAPAAWTSLGTEVSEWIVKYLKQK